MKKICAITFALLLALLPMTGLAAKARYPELSGAMTDAASVLSDQTKADVLALQSELDDEDAELKLHIVLVDFLDGQSAQSYADALFQNNSLGREDLLLLVAVGEDSYAVTVGKEVAEAFSQPYLQSKLLSTGFADQIKRQRYDAALAAFFSGFIADIKDKLDVKVSSGLFGRDVQAQSAQTQGSSYAQMLTDLINNITDEADKYTAQPVKSVTSKGLTPAGWVVLVVLILLVFSQSDPARKAKKNGCTGCGCAPLSSLFGAMGIATIIDRMSKRRR